MKEAFVLVWLCLIMSCTCIDNSAWAGEKGVQGDVVSLRTDQKSLGQVLLEIEKQTGYSINVENGVQQRNVTVKFDNVPLLESIRRLFSGRNYLMIFYSKTKKIDVISLGEAQQNSKKPLKNKEVVEHKLPGPASKGMEAIDSALALHQKAMMHPTEDSVQSEKSPMTASSEALEKHKKLQAHDSRTLKIKKTEKSPMTSSDKAVKLYQQGRTQEKKVQEKMSDSSPMSDVDAALKAYGEKLRQETSNP